MHYFDSGSGNTADSLTFLNTNRHELGDIVQAQIFSPHHEGPSAYTVALTDTRGKTLWLSGLTAGYHGAGPRAAQHILLECGFPDHDAQQVLNRSPVRLRRDVPPSAWVRDTEPLRMSREAPLQCRTRACDDSRDRR